MKLIKRSFVVEDYHIQPLQAVEGDTGRQWFELESLLFGEYRKVALKPDKKAVVNYINTLYW